MLIFHEIDLENLDVHVPMDYVNVLDEVDNRLIEREFFANFGPDAQMTVCSKVFSNYYPP